MLTPTTIGNESFPPADRRHCDLLRDYFTTAREELLWHAGHRDTWLKLHVVAQVAIFAIANGIDLGVFKASIPLPSARVFVFPVALVVSIFYFVEDRLVGLLSKYIGALTRAEARITNGQCLLSWDISPQLRRYATEGTLALRVIGQVAAFALLPFVLVCLQQDGPRAPLSRTVILSALACVLAIGALIAWSMKLRIETGDADMDDVLLPEAPTPTLKSESRWAKFVFALCLIGSIVLMLMALAQFFRNLAAP